MWGLISVSYYLTKSATKLYVKENFKVNERINLLSQIYIYFNFLLVASVLSYGIFYIISTDRIETMEGSREQIIGVRFHYLEILVPIIIPVIFAIFFFLRNHNKMVKL